MGKTIRDASLDASLNDIANNANRLDVTNDTATPTNLTNTLANVTLTLTAGQGDYTLANGDGSGRKVTISQQADISVTATGDASHVVLSDGTNIIAATTVTTQTLTSGNTVTVPAWDIEVGDPT